MENKNKINIEDKVMSEIKSGRIKLRSKYIFLAEKLGLGSAFALSVLLGVLFFTLVLFYLRASDNLRYLSFGSRGLFAFLQSFPYALVLAFIVMIFVAGVIIKKSGAFYHKPFGRIAVGLIGLILIVGVALTFTNIAEHIERRAFDGSNPDGMLFRPLFGAGFSKHDGGLAGKIVDISGKYIEVQTPFEVVKVDLSKLEEIPKGEIKKGVFIVAIGERKDNIFEPVNIQVMEGDDMPMIQRGVDRRFGGSAQGIPQAGSVGFCLAHCAQTGGDKIFCEKTCINN
ncbi:MAG: hypothetical protein WC457_03300 [Patescibacteria group bacterium]